MISRAVDLVGFLVCAGTTGVWTLFDWERIYFFLMFLGVVLFIRVTAARPAAREGDPASITRIRAAMYAQGLAHGEARAQARLNDGGQQWPKAG